MKKETKKEIFIVQKDIEEAPCEHPECERFHQRFMEGTKDARFHMTKTTWWIVVDTRTNSQVYNSALKKHCVWEADKLNQQFNEKQEETK